MRLIWPIISTTPLPPEDTVEWLNYSEYYNHQAVILTLYQKWGCLREDHQKVITMFHWRFREMLRPARCLEMLPLYTSLFRRFRPWVSIKIRYMSFSRVQANTWPKSSWGDRCFFLQKYQHPWGTWVTQSVKHLTLPQVMILWFMGSSPVSHSVLTAQSLEPVSESVFPSLSAPLPLMLCLSHK